MDTLSPEQRSANMGKIGGKNTSPELRVRRALHALGYRFRLHPRDLLGSPDIVLPRHRTIFMVHGCFWHRHPGCRFAYVPKSRAEFWNRKFTRNVERDGEVKNLLEAKGWKVHEIWECETKNRADLERRLLYALEDGRLYVSSEEHSRQD